MKRKSPWDAATDKPLEGEGEEKKMLEWGCVRNDSTADKIGKSRSGSGLDRKKRGQLSAC